MLCYRLFFFAIILASCRTESSRKENPPIVQPSNTPPGNSNTPDPALPPTPKQIPTAEDKKVEFIGSCLRVKANIPDAWLDCLQFYTGTDKDAYGRVELYKIQKTQCENSQNIAASFTWSDAECPQSEEHKFCPKVTSEDLSIYGSRKFFRYQEEYNREPYRSSCF